MSHIGVNVIIQSVLECAYDIQYMHIKQYLSSSLKAQLSFQIVEAHLNVSLPSGPANSDIG